MPAKMDTKKFIRRAKEIHGDKYDYSMTTYSSSRSRVTIVCEKHGPFVVTAASHLQGVDCMRCATVERGKRHRMSTAEFIKRSQEVHGDRYCYDEVEYITSKQPVRIICKLHGVFLQRPIVHYWRRSGCPVCGLGRQQAA